MEDRTRPSEPTLSEEFLRLFAVDQLRIQGYIRTLVFDRTAAADVFQETSLAMWRSFDTYDRSRPFISWALGIAKNQVFKYYRAHQQTSSVLSQELIEQLAGEAMQLSVEHDARLAALENCLSLLQPRQRELIDLFYTQHHSATEIARHWQRSVHAVYKALRTVRRSLLQCIESKLKAEA